MLQASQHQYNGVTLQVTPIGKELQTLSTNQYIFADFTLLQHQYISAIWLAAPIYRGLYMGSKTIFFPSPSLENDIFSPQT